MAGDSFDFNKNTYRFDQISFSQWRHPNLSVHPARGGPMPSARALAGRPWVPTYKVRFGPPIPPPTDDEDEEEGDDDVESDAEKVEDAAAGKTNL